MKIQDVSKAKKIFNDFEGSFFQMEREGIYKKYKSYRIPENIENQWRYEKIKKIEQMLLGCKNSKAIIEEFELYGHYAAQMKEETMLEFLLEYINKHQDEWDTNTIIRSVNTIFSLIDIIKYKFKKKEVIQQCIAILEKALKSGISISDDYKENGEIPNYLTTKRLDNNIKIKIEYWKGKLKDM